MNINNIQIALSLSPAVEERSNFRKTTASVTEANVPDAQDKTRVDNASIPSNENLMTVVYPPFFPVGNTQDILSIEGIRVPGEGAKSASSIVGEQKATRQREIDNKAANADTRAGRQDSSNSADRLIKGRAPEVKHGATPGVVLDLKV
jgi:hypothetical protein